MDAKRTNKKVKVRYIRQVRAFLSCHASQYPNRNKFHFHRTMRWNVTTRAMRTVKKYGSLDKYVLGVRNKWLGERAMWLRVRLQDEIRKRELADQASSGENDKPVHAED
jgi:hypothetical protein